MTEVDAYIDSFADPTRSMLTDMRRTILAAVPGLEEVISYGMPAYKRGHILVYYAGCAGHIGFYPTASGIQTFRSELLPYRFSKGAVRFPLTDSLPIELITRMVQFRAKEETEKESTRAETNGPKSKRSGDRLT